MPWETCVHCGENKVYTRTSYTARGYHPKCKECSNKIETRYCTVCGEPFKIKSTKFDKICSEKCRHQQRLNNAKKQYQKAKEQDPIPCPWCSEMFVPGRDQQFCSRSCATMFRHHGDKEDAEVVTKEEMKKRKIELYKKDLEKSVKKYLSMNDDPWETVTVYGVGLQSLPYERPADPYLGF